MSQPLSRWYTQDDKRSARMNQNNGNHSRVAVADLIDHESPASDSTTYYDPDEPVLKPAKQIGSGRNKSWKRSPIKWCCILLLIGGGAIALYLLVKVNRVPVKVQADAASNEAQRNKARTDGNNSENNLT